MTLRVRHLSARPFLLAVLALLLAGCGRNMVYQPRYDTYEESAFFDDGTSSRPLLEGTVPRQRGGTNNAFYTGMDENGFLTELPIELTTDALLRGQERYNVYCSPCHNYDGYAHSMIVQKGFVQPSSFHEQRLREQPVGYFFNAMTNGFGRMYSYASRIPPEDRWAIAAYIRALQLSQHAPLEAVPEEERTSLTQFQSQLEGGQE